MAFAEEGEDKVKKGCVTHRSELSQFFLQPHDFLTQSRYLLRCLVLVDRNLLNKYYDLHLSNKQDSFCGNLARCVPCS